jgi:hypothetical protein
MPVSKLAKVGKMSKYKAVTKKELLEMKKNGFDCSPCAGRDGYVLGYDLNGRFCHVASCFSYSEAVSYVNNKNKGGKDE